jgi:hypothetical protein
LKSHLGPILPGRRPAAGLNCPLAPVAHAARASAAAACRVPSESPGANVPARRAVVATVARFLKLPGHEGTTDSVPPTEPLSGTDGVQNGGSLTDSDTAPGGVART